MYLKGGAPTLHLIDTNQRSGMIHMNDNRMYFLSGVAGSTTWAQTANSKWPLYLQTDTNAAVFGGSIDATSGTVSATGFYSSGLSQFGGETQWTGTGNTSHANYGGNIDWYIRTANNNGKVVINDSGGVIGLGTASVSSGFRAEVNGKFKVTDEIQCNGQIFASSDISCSTRIYAYTGARIYGTEATLDYTNAQSDYLTNGGNVQVEPPNLACGLYVQNTIRARGITVFSDQRIKSNVVDINDTTALDQVRLLKPKYYEYVDKVTRGSSSVIGFIAQEVKEVLPRAVSVADGEIPNIYEIATISSNNTVTFTNFNTSNLEGTNCTLIAYLAKDKRKEVTITEVVDEHTVLVEEDMSEWGGQLFVWGQKVDDFHHLNKDYIWTVATAALQEVDRQLQAEKTRNDALEARILALENK
jgi:hypothetical protein